MPFKSFLSPSELHSRIADRKLSPLLSPLQDSLADKTLLEPREISRPKKVCFSESNLPTGDRSRRTYYLNGMVHTGSPGWGNHVLETWLWLASPVVKSGRSARVGLGPGLGLSWPFEKNVEMLILDI
jgi:hypothetical protein